MVEIEIEIHQNGIVFSDRFSNVSTPSFVSCLLQSVSHGIDLRQQLNCVVRTDEHNATFADVDFCDEWNQAVVNLRNRFDSALIPS